MFDDIYRALDRVSGTRQVRIDMPLDDDGYFDRQCRAPECRTRFKVLFEDWRDKVPNERAWCAVCGHLDIPSDFNTRAQDEYIRQHALRYIQEQFDDEMSHARAPRPHRAGFLTLSMTYKPAAPVIVVPYDAAEILSQRTTCSECGCRYASLGASFFCPACGHNSALSAFDTAIETVRQSMSLVERLDEMVDGRDAAADLRRHITEDALVRVWSSFQRFAEVIYSLAAADRPAPPRNAFQNLAKSSKLWRSAIGRTYAEMLDHEEHLGLIRLVQQRHLLAHRDGIVDEDYLENSGDKRYRVGQRMVVKPADVSRFADLVTKLAGDLRHEP